MGQISWEYYCRRIGIMPRLFISKSGCKTYDEFALLLKKKGVTPPSETEVTELFAGSEPESAVKQKPPVPVKAKPPPKPKRRKGPAPGLRSMRSKTVVKTKVSGSKNASKPND